MRALIEGSSSPGLPRTLLLVLLLAGIHLSVSFLTMVPGPLSIDEVTYHLMVKNFSDTGGLEIWNGYRECPSPELASASMVPVDGRLVPRPPYLVPVLGWPFYRLVGTSGLYALNALAFLGLVAVCFAIARRMFPHRSLSLNACVILALASYAWEYSQAAWPHVVAALFIAGAFYLTLLARDSGRSVAFACGAGCVLGFGAGIRLDVIFALPCLAVPLLLARPCRFREVLATGLGTLPGLVLLAAVNHIKFGNASPFSYGRSPTSFSLEEMGRYLPFVAAMLAVAMFVLAAIRIRAMDRFRSHRRFVFPAGVALGLLSLLIPQVGAQAWKFLHGSWQILVDLRIRPMYFQEPALTRLDGGGMVYAGGLKKALLQSCPYLSILLLPLVRMVRRHPDASRLFALFTIPAVYCGFYGYFAWHGGLCLNQRYLLPALVFTSILVAYAWRAVCGRFDFNHRRTGLVSGMAVALLFFAHAGPMQPNPLIEKRAFLLLTLPLILAGSLALALLWAARNGPGRTRRTGRAVHALLVAGAVWAGLVTFCHDHAISRNVRKFNLHTARSAARFIQEDSLLFVHPVDPFFGLPGVRRVRVADPALDDFEDFRRLAGFHLERGRPVYAAFPPARWKEMEARGLLASFSLEWLWCHPRFDLKQLREQSSRLVPY